MHYGERARAYLDKSRALLREAELAKPEDKDELLDEATRLAKLAAECDLWAEETDEKVERPSNLLS